MSLILHSGHCFEPDTHNNENQLPVEDIPKMVLQHIDWSYLKCKRRQRILHKQTKYNQRPGKMAKKNCDEWLLFTP
jgi:hypothetical protein